MAVNDLTFNQVSTILTEIVGQATGNKDFAVYNSSDFVTVAQLALKTGYDPLATAISQVLSKTLFSVRPYSAKFKGLSVDSIQYGNHVRKLQLVDKDFEEDDRLKLEDGESVDMYKVNKPVALQTNFYGANTFQKSMTIYKDQLDSAFENEAGFRSFLGMYMQNASDMIEQAKESMARSTIANLIGGTALSGDTDRVIYLIDEYNTETGSEVTADTVKSDDNFSNFAKWLYGFVKTLSQRLEERSLLYHTNIEDYPIMRHTPIADQKIYLYRPFFNSVDTRVLGDVYHDEYLTLADRENVTYWQSIKDPTSIDVTASYLSTDGSITSGEYSSDAVLGVIFDKEAAGITTVNEWSQATPFNARGGYYNQYFHFTTRWWNDFTENSVVLLLESAPTSDNLIDISAIGSAS